MQNAYLRHGQNKSLTNTIYKALCKICIPSMCSVISSNVYI